MKIPCEVISDLLPLYVDDLCSEETRQFVETHLSQCESCRLELELMQKNIPIITKEENLKEAQTFKNLSNTWKKKMLKSLLKGALFTLIIIVILLLILSLFVEFKVVPTGM